LLLGRQSIEVGAVEIQQTPGYRRRGVPPRRCQLDSDDSPVEVIPPSLCQALLLKGIDDFGDGQAQVPGQVLGLAGLGVGEEFQGAELLDFQNVLTAVRSRPLSRARTAS
jgi:hypothetical protein